MEKELKSGTHLSPHKIQKKACNMANQIVLLVPQKGWPINNEAEARR